MFARDERELIAFARGRFPDAPSHSRVINMGFEVERLRACPSELRQILAPDASDTEFETYWNLSLDNGRSLAPRFAFQIMVDDVKEPRPLLTTGGAR